MDFFCVMNTLIITTQNITPIFKVVEKFCLHQSYRLLFSVSNIVSFSKNDLHIYLYSHFLFESSNMNPSFLSFYSFCHGTFSQI